MKKLFCILTVLLMAVSVASATDRHYEMVCTYSGSSGERIISLDIFEQEQQVITVSNLFPEYAVQSAREYADIAGCFEMLISSGLEQIMRIQNTADTVLIQYLDRKLSPPDCGIFSGVLFDHAATVRKGEFPLSDMLHFFREYMANCSEPEGCVSVLSSIIDTIDCITKPKDLTMFVQSFDEDCFLSFQIIEKGSIILSLSVDRTDGYGNRYIIGCREEDRYIFRDLKTSINQNRLFIQSSLCTGKTFFSSVSEQLPLFTEELTVSDETDHTFSFQYIFRSDKLNEPLFITGNTIRQNDGYRTLNAAVGVEKPEQTVLSIRLNSETLNRPISVSDKTIFDPESDKDNPAVYLSAATNAVIFASEILPILPQDYQQLVLNLIYPN